jgi:hypothetical protein
MVLRMYSVSKSQPSLFEVAVPSNPFLRAGVPPNRNWYALNGGEVQAECSDRIDYEDERRRRIHAGKVLAECTPETYWALSTTYTLDILALSKIIYIEDPPSLELHRKVSWWHSSYIERGGILNGGIRPYFVSAATKGDVTCTALYKGFPKLRDR